MTDTRQDAIRAGLPPDPNLFIPMTYWANTSVRLAVPLVTIPYEQRYINIRMRHYSEMHSARLDAKSVGYFQRYIQRLIDVEGIEDASRLCFDLLFEHMKPNRTYASKLQFARSLFDQYWRPYADIKKISNMLSKLRWSRYQWSKYKDSIVRTIGDMAMDYRLQFDPSLLVFTRIRPYQILIDEYNLLISDEYIAKYLKSHTNNAVDNYLKSKVALCTKPVEVIKNALINEVSLRGLPMELLNIIAGYIR